MKDRHRWAAQWSEDTGCMNEPRVVQTSDSSLSSSIALCTMGPRTAYSTFFTVGFMVSMVNTLARDDTPFSVIFSLGSPRRVALTLDKALPGEEEDRGGEVSEWTLGPPPLPPANNSLRPRLRNRTFLGDSSCILVADMFNTASWVTLKASAVHSGHTTRRLLHSRSRVKWSCASERTTLLKILTQTFGPLRAGEELTGLRISWTNSHSVSSDPARIHTHTHEFTLWEVFWGACSLHTWQRCSYPSPFVWLQLDRYPTPSPPFPYAPWGRLSGSVLRLPIRGSFETTDVAQRDSNQQIWELLPTFVASSPQLTHRYLFSTRFGRRLFNCA